MKPIEINMVGLTITGLVLVTFLCMVFLCLDPVPYFLRHKRFEEFKIEGARIVQAVEDFRESNARLPETLSEALPDESDIRVDEWRYGVEEDGFYLYVGSYAVDWFELGYDSEGVGWYFDT